MRGDFHVLDDDLRGLTIPHAQAAGMFGGMGRNLRRTDARGLNTVPMALAISGLRGQQADGELVERIYKAHEARLSAGRQTSLQIGPGTLDHRHDIGVQRSDTLGPRHVQDARDDAVLSRLMDLHGVDTIARTAPGVDARWRMHARSACPYVNYAGLPADMPPFILRPRWRGGDALVEIALGQGVTYCNLEAYRMITVDSPLPDTIAIALAGKRVTEVIAHAALDGLMFAAPDDHAVDGALVVVEVDTN